MTGFGKGLAELPGKKITVEVKSLNSKQADISVKIPSLLREHELTVRQRTASALVRGKIDLTIAIETAAAETSQTLNLPALAAYKEQVEKMSSELGLPLPTDWYGVLLRMPDSLRSANQAEAEEADIDALISALDQATSALTTHRRAEGEKLEQFFTARINRISELLAEVPRYEKERIARIRGRIEEGLSGLQGVDYDRSRLEQELFFYIEKLDINEEKQRLAQHLRYFIETMNESDGSQGKKLGFIAQEMGREINTLGSKSNHSEMQRLVVEMKDELEQIKEQVLNVL